MEAPRYLHLKPEAEPRRLDDATPFKAVLVIESDTTPEWISLISHWLVQSGCRHMSAWGKKCGDWHSAVDEANMAMCDYKEILDDAFVMTTDHEKQPLAEVFWFAGQCAVHPSLELERTYILHIAEEDRAAELLKIYSNAQEEDD